MSARIRYVDMILIMAASESGAYAADPDPGRGVYAISVAAELVGMGSQTLRLDEQEGRRQLMVGLRRGEATPERSK
jgi:hypothetical protein